MDNMKAINYGLVAVTINESDPSFGKMLHFCGYENKPTTEDKLDLALELNTVPFFGLVGRMGKDVFLVDAPADVVNKMAECIKVPEERWC